MTEPIKRIFSEAWVIDTETVPCIETIRKVYSIAADVPDDIALLYAYTAAGATEAEPHPMLKTIFHRVVAISFLRRKETPAGVQLSLHSLPVDDSFNERIMIETFLTELGNRKPQIVGYNTTGYDLPMIYQRAIIHGIEIAKFCDRPEKPWDPKPDYFNAANDWNVDLMKVVGGYSKTTPKLVEIAKACGIPAKVGDVDGSEVSKMWLSDKRREIVNYCDHDVLTTYLLWLRTARVCGLLTANDVEAEERMLNELLITGAAERPHFSEFLNQWTPSHIKQMEVAA